MAGNTPATSGRTLKYVTNPTNSVFEWLRLPGDIVFIVGGVLPFLWICWLGVRHTLRRGTRTTLEEPEDMLFTDITVPTEDGREREATAAASSSG